MNSKDLLVEFYDPLEDLGGAAEYDDRRRPRLCMRHLRKLRQAKDAERVDKAEHVKFIPQMYNPPEPSDGGGEL